MRIARICRSSREAGARVAGERRTDRDVMLIVAPDFERHIDLPGAGPCPRPVEIERSGTGFSDLVSLRVYRFARGVTIDGEAEDDEVFIVVMRGQAGIVITQADQAAEAFSLACDGGLRAVYMPPHAAYRLTAAGDCDIAYARARPTGVGLPPVRGFAVTGTRLEITGHAQAMDLALVAARAGEVIALGANGRWPERFVHVRGDQAISVAFDGAHLGDWSTVALAVGEPGDMTVEAGTGEILLIAAATNRDPATWGASRTV
jgi:hypothetical protein